MSDMKQKQTIEGEILMSLDRIMQKGQVILSGDQYSQQMKDQAKQIVGECLDSIIDELSPIKIDQEVAKIYRKKMVKEMEKNDSKK